MLNVLEVEDEDLLNINKIQYMNVGCNVLFCSLTLNIIIDEIEIVECDLFMFLILYFCLTY